MEKATYLKTGATAAAFLLIGTFAVAQTAATSRTLKPRDASSGQASGIQQRKVGAIAHADYSRPADQTKSGNTGGIDGGSNATAHAAARSKAPNKAPDKASNNARTGENPLYEDSGKSGTNPLFESKDQMMKPNAGNSNSQSAPKTAADTSRKHVGGVKYQNRTSGQKSNKRSSTENFKQDFGQVQATKR